MARLTFVTFFLQILVAF